MARPYGIFRENGDVEQQHDHDVDGVVHDVTEGGIHDCVFADALCGRDRI